MGANLSVATSTVNNIVNAGITAATNFSLTCASTVTNEQTIVLGKGCTFKAANVTVENTGVIINKCVSDVSNKQNLQNSITQAIHQATEAAKQQLGILNIGQASAQISTSITNAETNLATTITNAYSTGCGGQLTNTQTFKCEEGSLLDLTGNFTIKNAQFSINECALKLAQQSDGYIALKQAFEQSTVAKEESIFSIYVVVGLVSVAIIALVIVNMRRSGANGLPSGSSEYDSTTWIVIGIIILIGIIIVAYAALASSNGWWPFVSTAPSAKGYKVQ